MPSEQETFENSSTKDRIQCGKGYLVEFGEQIKSDSTLRESVRLSNSSAGNNKNLDLAEIAHEPKFFFLCGRCDMLVREDDAKCQFCGAEFVSDEDESTEEPEVVEVEEVRVNQRYGYLNKIEPIAPQVPMTYKEQVPRIPPGHRIGKVDVIGMFDETHEENQDIEHSSGGTSQAHSYAKILLRNTEKIMQEATDFGADTDKAKKYLIFARRAFNEGKMNQAIALSEKARSILTPNVTSIIRGQISCLREAMIEMKHHGKALAPMIVEMKTIQMALKDSKLDKAIEQTISLMAETRKAQMELTGNVNEKPLIPENRDSRSSLGEGI